MNIGPFLLLSLGGQVNLCFVVSKNRQAFSVMTTAPLPLLHAMAEGTVVATSSTFAVELHQRLRSIAVVPLQEVWEPGHAEVYVQAALPSLVEGEGGVLEVLLDGNYVAVPYTSWDAGAGFLAPGRANNVTGS